MYSLSVLPLKQSPPGMICSTCLPSLPVVSSIVHGLPQSQHSGQILMYAPWKFNIHKLNLTLLNMVGLKDKVTLAQNQLILVCPNRRKNLTKIWISCSQLRKAPFKLRTERKFLITSMMNQSWCGNGGNPPTYRSF